MLVPLSLYIDPFHLHCTLSSPLLFGFLGAKPTKGMLLSQDMMEVDTRTSHSSEKRPLGNSTPANQQKMPAEKNMNSPVFVNHAAIAWDENRRKWTGNLSQKPKRIPKDPIISWSMTYEDLLSTSDPFSEAIPLTEMVDFLVDIWQDEGLFD